jgi:hypothetical protein
VLTCMCVNLYKRIYTLTCFHCSPSHNPPPTHTHTHSHTHTHTHSLSHTQEQIYTQPYFNTLPQSAPEVVRVNPVSGGNIDLKLELADPFHGAEFTILFKVSGCLCEV